MKQQLEAKDAMERSTRRALVQSIKAEWVQQAEAQRGRNQVNRAFLEEGMTPATCGLGALQKLEGEDVGLAERRQAQARAQRAWILEQLGKKESARRAAAAQEAAEVAAQVHIQELLRTHAEAEAAYRKALTEAIQVENKEQAARERAAVAAAEAGRRAEEQALLERLRRDPMLSEVNDCVCPATGRVLPDRFRGYTAEQRARIAAENSALVHEKSRRQEEERAAEAAWARQQEAWSLRVKQLQKAEEKARKDLELVTRAALQEQEEDHRKRTEQARADAFGRIEQEQGLHSKFGTSLA